VLVTHGGWLSAALWLQRGRGHAPCSRHWPDAPRHGERTDLAWPSPGGGC